jgi:hypothetical protein
MSTPPPHSATFDVTATVSRLAANRPLFHSEADFQHALAWQLHLDDAHLRIRPEYCPNPTERVRADIWTVTPDSGTRTAFELKYLVRAVETTVAGERFVLRNQGAHDISRYDVVKDVHRVERWVDTGLADRGYVIVLSNDPGYWNRSDRDTIDAAFRLHHGRVLQGSCAWHDRAGAGTTRGRGLPLLLYGTYTLRWQPYSTVDGRPLRALTIPIGRP